MSKLSCEIIKDLLPLYIDNVCSEESRKTVEEHLKDCPICEAELIKIQNTPDIKKTSENTTEPDIDKAVKNANKRIKKGKKAVIIKTLSITVAVLLIAGIFAYLTIPVKLCIRDYNNLGYLYAKSNAITIDITNSEETNHKNRYSALFIDEKHGKYTVESLGDCDKIVFEDGKMISIISVPLEKENIQPFMNETKLIGFEGTSSLPFFMPLIKKGVENMGINTDLMCYESDIYIHLITTQEDYISQSVMKSPKNFSMCYAYYALYSTIMPTGNSGYYITAENDDIQGYGWSSISEDGTRYILNMQEKDNIFNQATICFDGFTKDEMIEIIRNLELN